MSWRIFTSLLLAFVRTRATTDVRVSKLACHLPPAAGFLYVRRRYLISGCALEFHPLGKALPVRCQPENYWGSEGQYRAWVLE